MTAVLQTPEVACTSADTAWSEIPAEKLPYWNDLLLQTGASVYQYPFASAPYERLFFTPRHLAYGAQEKPSAYACILTVGFHGFRVGLVFRGPVSLVGRGPVPQEALASLSRWAAREGYVFLRFTPEDAPTFGAIATMPGAHRSDLFPFYLDYGQSAPELVVEQKESDTEMLASFDREARRKIRRASECNYEIRSAYSEQALAELWPLYEQCVRRKGFRLERPLSFYKDLVRAARCHDAVRIYSAWLDGRPCAMTLVLRDRDTAHCLLAAHDAADGTHGTATLLHWTSMRDMHRLGTRYYNMGSAPGSLARFKQQFSPRPVICPGVVSLVVDERRFKLWRGILLPLARAVRPSVRKLSGSLYQNNSRLLASILSPKLAAQPGFKAMIRRSA